MVHTVAVCDCVVVDLLMIADLVATRVQYFACGWTHIFPHYPASILWQLSTCWRTGIQELCYCVLVRNLVKLCLKYMRWRCKQCIPHMLVPINHITSRDNTEKTIWIFTTITTTCFVISLIQCLNPCITCDAAFYAVGVLCDLCATGMLASNQRFGHPSRLSVC